MDEEGDVVGNLTKCLLGGEHPTLGDPGGQPIHRRRRRVGVGGAHRPGAGLHGLEHGSSLAATHLTDDDP